MTLEIGTQLGSYCVTGHLGSGGMGEIYRAQDTRLGRDVALKVLPPRIFDRQDWVARFEREARIVSRLNHPHILTIHEVGQVQLPGHFDLTHFIVTEFVDGITLRQAMHEPARDLRRLLELLAQVCDALRKAHSAGVVHRDLKPENIMFSRDGYAKVLDFGLAKVYSDPAAPAAETEKGIAMGTCGYMAPEQIQGKPVDHRADVFAFGCVLFELLGGAVPFAGHDLAVTLHRITGGKVPPLPADVDPALRQIVKRCLEKSPAKRFQTMAEIADGLRAVAARLKSGIQHLDVTPPAVVRRSIGRLRVIAVMPFANTSDDPEMEYLSDGITESIIYALSRVRKRVRVVARNTVFAYKNRPYLPAQLSAELDATAIVTGRVQRVGSSIVVAADLVSTADGSQIWGERFHRPFSDIFEVQDQIATSISDQLKLRLTVAERRQLLQRPTVRSEAYELYLKGRFHLNRRTAEGFERAAALFRDAVAVDPKYALAWAGIADVHAIRSCLGIEQVSEHCALAEDAARKAIALDPTLGGPHATLGLVAMQQRWNWDEAERCYRTAIAIDPDLALAHNWYARLLLAAGRTDEAMLEARAAISIEPRSPVFNSSYAGSLWLAGRYDEARRFCEKVLDLEPSFHFVYWLQSLIAFAVGEAGEAVATLEKTIESCGRRPELLGTLGYIQARLGNRDAALATLRDIAAHDHLRQAEVQAGLGEIDAALEHVEQLFHGRGDVVAILLMPQYRELREDPRFAEMLARVRFPDLRRTATTNA